MLLEVRLLHQPVHDAAEQLCPRAAAGPGPGPDPGLIREELRHPALAHAAELQERPTVGAPHQGFTLHGHAPHHPVPRPPFRGAAGEPGRHRVIPAGFRELRDEGTLHDVPGRQGRENLPQGRVDEAEAPGVARPGNIKKRAAADHVLGNVREILRRQDAAQVIPVEDDEMKVVEVGVEQLPGRERDQGQLLDRGGVLLGRRPQDRKVHEVDRGVRLEQVAPVAQPHARLARNKHDAEPVADRIDVDDHPVVVGRELTGDGSHLQGDGHHARPLQRQFELGGRSDLQHPFGGVPAGHGNADRFRLAHGRFIQKCDPELRGFADDAVAGCPLDDQAAVPFAGGTGQQGVDGSVESQCRQVVGNVVHLPIGDQHDGGDTVRGHVGQSRARGSEQLRPRPPAAHGHGPHFQPLFVGQILLQRLDGG